MVDISKTSHLANSGNIQNINAGQNLAPIGNIGKPQVVSSGDKAQKAINAPKNNVMDYMSHCDNGIHTLCEKYSIDNAKSFLSADNIGESNMSQATKMLDLGDVERLQNLTKIEDLPNDTPTVTKELLEQIIDGMEMQEGMENSPLSFQTAVKALVLMLRTDNLKASIEAENYLNEVNGNDPKNDVSINRLKKHIVEQTVRALKSQGKRVLDETSLKVALEQTEYDMSSANDMLKITNQAMASLFKMSSDKKIENLANSYKKLLSDQYLLNDQDDCDSSMKKLASCKREIKSIISELKRMVKKGDNSAVAKEQLECLDALLVQVDATAKLSLKHKIQEAQKERVNALYESGDSQSAAITIEVGPEFSLLNDRIKLGISFAFTYTYAINVSQPYGKLSVVNTLEPGVKPQGSFGTDKDPVTGKITAKIGGFFLKTHVYNNPDELVDAESGNMFKQLMHYMKPMETAEPSDSGKVEEERSWISDVAHSIKESIKGAAKGAYYRLRGLFTSSPETAAKKALMQNAEFKKSMYSLGVFKNFDTIKRSSVNRTFYSEIGEKGFNVDISAKGKNKNSSVVKGGEGTFNLKRIKKDTRTYQTLLSQIGNGETELENYLQDEYNSYSGAMTPLLQKEITEFTNAQNGNVLSPKLLLENIANLKGEFEWFCKEVNHDDLVKKGFHSSRSTDRAMLMESRMAANRGEYLRALMIRCASLKFQLAKQSGKLSDEELKMTGLCGLLLDKLSAELERPPVILSKKNQLCFTEVNHRKSTSTTLSLGLSVIFNPPPIAQKVLDNSVTNMIAKGGKTEDVKVNVKGSLKIPSSKNGYYKNHKTGTISFSVTGDMLLQYGPQLVSHVLQMVQKNAAAKGKDDPDANDFGTLIGDTLGDYIGNIANDIDAGLQNKKIQDEIDKYTITKFGKEYKGEELFKAGIKNTNEFTVTIKMQGTENGVRYGGLAITNTRGQTIHSSAGIPVAPTIKMNTKYSMTTKSTEAVLSSLGTDSFAQLCTDIYEVIESPKGCELYARNHAAALSAMSQKCLVPDTKLCKDLQGFLKASQKKCDALTQEIKEKKVDSATLRKARNFSYLTFTLLNSINKLPCSKNFMASEVVTVLADKAIELNTQLLMKQDRRLSEKECNDKSTKVWEQIKNSQEPDDIQANDVLVNMAGTMQLMDIAM